MLSIRKPRRRWIAWAAAALATILVAIGAVRRERTMRAAIAETLETAFPNADSSPESQALHEFYGRRDQQRAWTNGSGLTGRGRALQAMLAGSAGEGLDPDRYVGDTTALHAAFAAVRSNATPRRVARLDVLLTLGLRRYLQDMDAGLHRNEEGRLPRVPRARMVRAVLVSAARLRDPDRPVKDIEPADPQYDALKAALERYREIARKGGWPTVHKGPAIPAAATNRMLRARLLSEGDAQETALVRPGNAGGKYGADLERAVRHFQSRHGLKPDGVVGPNTLRALNQPVARRIAELSLNLDRWRSMPRSVAPLEVRVNIPAYELTVLRDGEPVQTMPVIVGRSDRQTPVMLDTIRSIVAHPYWNVPVSIVENEILPALRKDGGYLEKHDMEIVARADPDRVIPPEPIDWDDVDVDSLLIRQRPGPQNALGALKFVLPNREDIYLHDTPDTKLFDQRVRAFSHGCVRVARPLELDPILLQQNNPRSSERLDSLVATKHLQRVELDPGVPVALVYFTVWVGPEGEVRFLPDV